MSPEEIEAFVESLGPADASSDEMEALMWEQATLKGMPPLPPFVPDPLPVTEFPPDLLRRARKAKRKPLKQMQFEAEQEILMMEKF